MKALKVEVLLKLFSICIILFSICCVVTGVTYEVNWAASHLKSISNQMSVCLGDKVNLTCPGSDSTVIYSNSESHYNNCTYDGTCNFGNSGDPYKFGDCTLNGMIILDVKSTSLQFSCLVKFNSGQTSYFYSSYSNDCESGLKLKLIVLNDTNAQCITPSISSSSSPTINYPTNSGGVASNLPSGTRQSSIPSSSSLPNKNTATPTTTPKIEGAGQDEFFDTLGNREIGVIAGGGVLFLILLVLFVFGIVIFCFVVQKGRGSAELNKDSEKDIEQVGFLEETDSLKKSNFPNGNSDTKLNSNNYDSKPKAPSSTTDSINSQSKPRRPAPAQPAPHSKPNSTASHSVQPAPHSKPNSTASHSVQPAPHSKPNSTASHSVQTKSATSSTTGQMFSSKRTRNKSSDQSLSSGIPLNSAHRQPVSVKANASYNAMHHKPAGQAGKVAYSKNTEKVSLEGSASPRRPAPSAPDKTSSSRVTQSLNPNRPNVNKNKVNASV